jgi:histidine triad (HIT) family protein
MAEGCAFCRIAAGDTAASVVLDDDVSLAFLDHRPVFPGHVLLIPKRHVATLADLPGELVGPLFDAARRLATALERGLGAEGAFVAVNHRVSQSVPHLHVHVIPRRRKDGLRGFFWPRQRYESREAEERVRAAIAEAVGRPAQP